MEGSLLMFPVNLLHQYFRKFDLGIYVAVTSLHPLRVYYYDGDILLRFCPDTYEPFDPNNENKYVVGDDYVPAWQVGRQNIFIGRLLDCLKS